MSTDNDMIPEPDFGETVQHDVEKEVPPSEGIKRQVEVEMDEDEDEDEDDIARKGKPKKKGKVAPAKEKASMGVFKMSLIAVGVSAALFVVGFGLMVALSPSSSKSALPEDYGTQTPADNQFPDHPDPVAQIPTNNDELAGVANEIGGGNDGAGSANMALPRGGAPANFDPANYVTVSQYKIMQTQLEDVSRRLQEYEQGGGRRGGSMSSGTIDTKLANFEQRLGNIESYLETVKTSLSAVEEVVAQKKKEIFEREGNIRTDVPESAKGRSRLVGYQYAMGTENKDVAIVIDGKNGMTVLTSGVSIDYQGQSIAVTKVLNQENIVLLGDKYFIDKTKGIGPAGQAGQVAQDSMKVKSVSPVSRPERQASKPVGVKKISGWRVLAATPDPTGGYEATVETPSGGLITLKRGERVKVYGQVTRVTESNVYFNNHMF